jgi:glycerol-3-phosphate acyltransferase PlsY
MRMRAIGATTASLELGPKVGCTIGILDILKAVLPVLALKLWYPGEFYHLVAAVFVVVGHNWPLYYRFKGGGGISPTYGGFFVVDFIGTVVSAFTGLIFGLFVLRSILFAYNAGLWFMLIWLIIFKGEWPYIVYGVVMNIIFIAALIPEFTGYIKYRRENKNISGEDRARGMEVFPMGRGMLKIMKYFGVEPKGKAPNAE